MSAAADTIAAIATAAGGGVGIVRVSGPDAERIARALVPELPRTLASHRMTLGQARDRGGRVLDDVLTVLMRAPRSYTGEDTAELHGHGGAAVLQALLDAALAAGARLATPGEFTRRAFLAGKMDLTQAEAVASLIGARDARSLASARRLREGVLGRRVDGARRQIVAELAELEGAIDFPDDAQADAREPSCGAEAIESLGEELARVAAAYRRPLEVAPEVLIVGRPNAGKSSLLNALAGEERALVDEAPGTTRDLVEAEVALGDLRVRLVDTAGARTDAGALERRGQALAEARRARAAGAIVVFDGTVGWSSADEELVASLRAALLPVVCVANKGDLPFAVAAPDGALEVSAKTGAGLAELRDTIARTLGPADEEVPVASSRQAEALTDASRGLASAARALRGHAAEVAAVELRRALHALGLVTGETVDDEVLDALFSRFCIGK